MIMMQIRSLLRYGYLSIFFKKPAVRHLGYVVGVLGPTTKSLFVVGPSTPYIFVQNLVEIDADCSLDGSLA